MRVLVTGAGGFVGSHAVRALHARGHDVHAIVRPASSRARLEGCGGDGHGHRDDDGRDDYGDGDGDGGITVWSADLDDEPAVRRVVHEVGPEAALHLAWLAGPRAVWSVDGNLAAVEQSVRLVRLLRDAGCARLVTSGSCIESQPPRSPAGRLPYSVGKRAFHELACTSMNAVCAHLFAVFGPFDDPRRVIPSAVRALLAGQPFAVSEGAQIRDLVAVEDVACALALLVESDLEGTVEVCSGEARTWRDALSAFERAVGVEGLLQFGAAVVAPEELFDAPGSPHELERLGWKPARSFDDAVRHTVEWWAAHPVASRSEPQS